MRKLLFLLAALLCVFVSCQKVGPQGPPGPEGPQGASAEFDILKLDVPAKAWQYSGQDDNNYFCATVEVPELTEDAFDYGVVSLYRTYNYDSFDASQIVLPYVRLCEEVADTDTFFYTETIDYEYGIGWVNIYYTVSDFIYEWDSKFAPVDMQFRMVIAY